MSSKHPLKVVTLEKRATIDRAAVIRNRVSEALTRSDRVLINLAQVEFADLTMIQLLYAAAREAADAGKELGFTGAVPEAVRQALENGGFCKHSPTDARRLGEELLDLTPVHFNQSSAGSEPAGDTDYGQAYREFPRRSV